MPRLVVFEGTRKLMDEHVVPAHLDDEHCSVQLLERLAWALEDGVGEPPPMRSSASYLDVERA